MCVFQSSYRQSFKKYRRDRTTARCSYGTAADTYEIHFFLLNPKLCSSHDFRSYIKVKSERPALLLLLLTVKAKIFLFFYYFHECFFKRVRTTSAIHFVQCLRKWCARKSALFYVLYCTLRSSKSVVASKGSVQEGCSEKLWKYYIEGNSSIVHSDFRKSGTKFSECDFFFRERVRVKKWAFGKVKVSFYTN